MVDFTANPRAFGAGGWEPFCLSICEWAHIEFQIDFTLKGEGRREGMGWDGVEKELTRTIYLYLIYVPVGLHSGNFNLSFPSLEFTHQFLLLRLEDKKGGGGGMSSDCISVLWFIQCLPWLAHNPSHAAPCTPRSDPWDPGEQILPSSFLAQLHLPLDWAWLVNPCVDWFHSRAFQTLRSMFEVFSEGERGADEVSWEVWLENIILTSLSNVFPKPYFHHSFIILYYYTYSYYLVEV